MTRAQEICEALKGKAEQSYVNKAGEIFNWILDFIESKINKGSINTIEVYLYYDEDRLLLHEYVKESLLFTNDLTKKIDKSNKTLKIQ